MERILIVDDKEENLYLLRTLLERFGYEVVQASNGSEAIPIAIETLPDMIISDILMPVMDGFALCAYIKADKRFKKVPFVFYTATYTDLKDEKYAYAIGADAFIIKPTEPEEFMRRISKVLDSGRSGDLVSTEKPALEESVVLKEYNEVLIRKLEQKMLGLEEANKALEAEMAARKLAENELLEALSEKDVLVAEIHHRVKNNMQVIISLLSIQLDNPESLTLEKMITIGHDLRQRILSMALVHDMLYQSPDLSKINFNIYTSKLIESLLNNGYVKSGNVTTVIDVAEKPIPITVAIPLGMIVNELATNSMKHAFPDGRKGEIRITLTIDDDDNCNLTVQDNGKGLADGNAGNPASSFGMQLVSVLVVQLKGLMKINNNEGTAISVSFRA